MQDLQCETCNAKLAMQDPRRSISDMRYMARVIYRTRHISHMEYATDVDVY
jgi:hypothetical protein